VVLMLRSIAGGLGRLLIVVGGIFLGQGVELIGGSFMTGRGRWAVTGVVMIAFGICLLAAARYRDRGPRAMTELDEIRLAWPSPERVRSSKRSPRAVGTLPNAACQ
jgi:hypothetical protein